MKLVDYSSRPTYSKKVKQLLSYAIGPTTNGKLDEILEQVYSHADAKLDIFIDNDGVALGIVGFRRAGESAEILHLAVDKDHRNCGVGRSILEELLKLESLTDLTAKTDHDSVGFYRRCGFAIESLGEKYPGVDRFHCHLFLN